MSRSVPDPVYTTPHPHPPAAPFAQPHLPSSSCCLINKEPQLLPVTSSSNAAICLKPPERTPDFGKVSVTSAMVVTITGPVPRSDLMLMQRFWLPSVWFQGSSRPQHWTGFPSGGQEELDNTTCKCRVVLTPHWKRSDQGETVDRTEPTNK